jgi:hypothetical protein
MTKIPANYFRDLAVKQGRKLASIPLKDGSAAKVLTGESAVDCYIVKNGRITEGTGFQSKANYEERTGALLERLQAIAADKVDVFEKWSSSLDKNTPDL